MQSLNSIQNFKSSVTIKHCFFVVFLCVFFCFCLLCFFFLGGGGVDIDEKPSIRIYPLKPNLYIAKLGYAGVTYFS